MNKLTQIFCLLTYALLFPLVTNATVYELASSGDWSSPSIWISSLPGTVPGASDTVRIPNASNDDLTITGNESCNALQYEPGTGTPSITIDGGNLTIGSQVRVTASSGTFSLAIINSGTFTCNGFFIFRGISSGNVSLILGQGSSVDFNGPIYIGHSSTSTNCTIDLSGTNSFFYQGNSLTSIGSFQVLNFDFTENTYVYDGSAPQTVNSSILLFDNLIISNPSGVSLLTDLDNSNFYGDLTINSGGVLDTDGYAITGNGNATLAVDTASLLRIDSSSVFPTGFSTISLEPGSYVEYSNNGNQAVAAINYQNLIISGSGTKTLTTYSGNPTGGIGVYEIVDVQSGDFDLNNLSFYFHSSTKRTATLAELPSGSAVLNGSSAVAQRYFDGTGTSLGYRHLACPVQGETINAWRDLSSGGESPDGIYMTGFTGSDNPSYPFVSIYEFSESNISNTGVDFDDFQNGWTGISSASDPISPSASSDHGAFAVYTGGGNFPYHHLNMIGTPFQGDRTIDLTANGGNASQRGWNFIGNPYMSAIDYAAIQADNPSLGASAFVFDVTSGYNGVWQGNNQIASSQAFFVKVSSNSTITISEDHKITTDVDFVRNQANDQQRILMLIRTPNGLENYTGIDFGQAFDDDFTAEDVEEFTKYAPYPQLSIKQNNTLLDLSKVSSETGSHTFDLVTESFQTGTHQLIFEEFPFSNACVTLEDLNTNSITPIQGNDTILFQLTSADTGVRFRLHVTRLYQNIAATAETCFGSNDGEIIVNALNNSAASLKLLDIVGNAQFNGSLTNDVVVSNLEPGVYFATIEDTASTCPSSVHKVIVEAADSIGIQAMALDDTVTLSVSDSLLVAAITNVENVVWKINGTNAAQAQNTYLSLAGYNGITQLVAEGTQKNTGCTITDTITIYVQQNPSSVIERYMNNGFDLRKGSEHYSLYSEKDYGQSYFELYDAQGKLVRSFNQSLNQSGVEIKLNESAGIYFLHVRGENLERTFKLVK
ncbi:MAG: hypothetical protein CL843_13310 [Crocinitomicaceae bacterium]|nr:hypothetical protein [Crocinitomicaceae bacterium]|tara:strand:- start:1454 stop:4444 length:2991 start_codon:yes stop_codon:yes gene_type:complete